MSCIVRGCSNTRHPTCNVKFHSFPKNPEKRKAWLSAVPLKRTFDDSANICSQHFKNEDYDLERTGCLLGDAVPFSTYQICCNALECVPSTSQTQLHTTFKEDCMSPTHNIFPQNSRTAFYVPSDTEICSDLCKDTEFYDRKEGLQRIKVDGVPVVDEDFNSPIAMRVCKICLCLDAKMYHIKEFNLDKMYLNVVGKMPRLDEWLPHNICWECAARLSAAASFKDKAMLADAVLTRSFNHADLLRIHQQHKNLKSKLTIKKLVTNHFFDYQQPDSLVQPKIIDIPNNDEIEIELNELVTETIRIKDEKNTLIEECDSLEQDDVKTEVDLVPTVKVDSLCTEDETDYFVCEESSLIDTEDTVTESIKIDAEAKNSNEHIFVAENNKQLEDTKLIEIDDMFSTLPSKRKRKIKQNNVVNISVVNKGLNTPMLCIEALKIEKPKVAKKKPVKRTTNTRTYVAPIIMERPKKQPYVKPSTPIDENVFTITTLNQEDLIQEVVNRKYSTKYLDAPFKCDVCYTGFPTKEKQERHALKHSEKSGPLKCVICKSRMKLGRRMRAHMKLAHSFEYTCKICPLVTRSKTVALGHMRFHAGRTFECPQCSEKFEKYTTLLNHKRLKHMTDCVCELCGYTFISQNGVRAHKARKHLFGEENAELQGPHCEVCDVKFLSQKAYDRHLRLSSKHIKSEDDPNRMSNDPSIKSRRVGWEQTKAVRRTLIRRRDENATSYSKGPVTCEQCGLVLKHFGTYASHFRSIHPGITRTQYPSYKTPFMCEHCGKIFWNSTFLEGHMWVHTGQKRFECDHCHKSFSMKSNLASHIKQHEPTRRTFTCKVCGKLFAFSYNLTRHMFIHTGLRPFKCDACEKAFSTSEQLRAHVDYVHLKKPRPKRIRRKVKKCDLPSLEYN